LGCFQNSLLPSSVFADKEYAPMILKRVRVKNFRSCRDATVETGNQVAIVGGNGTGKSTILRAIDRFYGQSTTVDIDDFFGKRVGEPIEISLTFTEFNEAEEDMFAARIHNGEMTVVRVFDAEGGKSNGKYYGATRQHAPFADIRLAANATAQRAAYRALREQGGIYASLPQVSAANQIPDALANWEAVNPGLCDLGRDDGQFFGFTNVAKGALQRATSFVFIPAVRDAAADAIDTSRAVVGRLMELVVRNAIQQRREIRDFQTRISNEYKELTDPAKLHELAGLSGNLTGTLQLFYREAAARVYFDVVATLSTGDLCGS
jgi:putative ATP-dependent endonuclease of the OLD family